jgi:hypothetical protein
MNAEQYLNEALGGNMNISTLKPLAWHKIMEGYARHKLAEAQTQADNKQSTPCCHCEKFPAGETALGWNWCPWCGRKL